jgi:hypothetical protein
MKPFASHSRNSRIGGNRAFAAVVSRLERFS